ncbi:ABC transporter ATP-binding protein [Dethiobacter alkaliphilus]|uniref:ABC transporter ATP-binding protein n=1 Tax=Dethiobacter alkaliphilus TaxID=427926 RepID=UPI00222615CF|nr:ABC transporter ATP-binding protein [Dethiobacter alkaliphilus]MCW3491581.1 ABC transporter ATP-binding protein [Dethiobacter alkaliphilus]
MNSIEIKGLKKSFGENSVLQGIDCTVKQGSVHGFLGPNGAGKTTAIKVILGLYKADAGTISLFGSPVSSETMKPLMENIGYLPQDPVFPEQYTGIEVMELIASLYNIPSSEKIPRIKELLKRFDLLGAGKRQVKNYSRGMKQRLGLATVWLPRPKLMILDEPVSALDPEGRYGVLEQIKELKGESSVFFSSHILSDVERVSDKITIIGNGKVLLEDSMENIHGTYISSSYLLRVPFDKMDEADKLLAQIPEIIDVTRDANNLLFQVDSKNLDAVGNKVLGKILEADIPVMRFSLQEATLEDVFLQLINGGTKQ